MVKLVLLLCVALAVPAITAADTLVTWTSNGAVWISEYHRQQNNGFVPPVGTPYQMTLSFDRGAITPNQFGSPGDNCFAVPVSGSLTLGGVSYGLKGHGWTHAMLPGLTCAPGFPETQFLLGLTFPPDNPWPAFTSFRPFMEAWYRDLANSNDFPVMPVALGMGFQLREQFGGMLVGGRGNLQGMSPGETVHAPEPGTLTLVGLGLAAAIRRARKLRSA